MKKIMSLFVLWALWSASFANAATYYVSPTGVSTNSGTSTSPWPVQYAADQTNPGDTVYFLTGTYSNFGGLSISRSGTAAAFITYAAAPGATPILRIPNPAIGIWQAINVVAHYIKIEGLELVGNNANISLALGDQIYAEALAGGQDWDRYAQTNTNGITIGNSSAIYPVHTEIRNCKIHDFGGAGIGSVKADYTTIENCTVYNNVWYNMYAGSGIALNGNVNTVSTTGFANVIRNNVVYNNKTLVKWLQTQTYSDGNGIIIDSFDHPYDRGIKAYTGKTLIENNLIYLNGGSGAYVMSSKNVTFRNNTCYWNSTQAAVGSGGGELVVFNSSNITWANNIAWANPAYASDVYALNDDGAWGSNSNITWKNNLTFNGTAGQSSVHLAKTTTTAIDSSNILGANPLVVNAGSDFHLQLSSPAINAGTTAYGNGATDLDGNPRLRGVIDLGCYENPNASTNINPSVSITSPLPYAEINAPGPVTINATASDSDGTITKVDFFNGTTLLGTDMTSPYSFTWSNVAKGNYIVTARAYDNANGTKDATVSPVCVLDPSLADLTIQAEALNGQDGTIAVNSGRISGLSVGQWARYDNVNFSTGFNYLQVFASARQDNIGFDVRLDSLTGPLVGSITLTRGGVQNIMTQVWMPGATGVHTIYLIGKGTYGASIDWFKFSNHSL